MFVDINLIYLTAHCGVIHYQELVRIVSTLPLRVPTFSCIQISVCYILLQGVELCVTKTLIFRSQSTTTQYLRVGSEFPTRVSSEQELLREMFTSGAR